MANDIITRNDIFNALYDVAHDIEEGRDTQARQKLAAIARDLTKGPLNAPAETLPPEDVRKASAQYADNKLAIVAPEMARSNYTRNIKNSQIHFCAGDLEDAFEEGYDYSQKRLWHPGSEKPEVEDGSGRLFVVIPSVACDMEAFFCYYNNGQVEPWGAVALPSNDPYHLSLHHDEVERWADFDELMCIRRQQ